MGSPVKPSDAPKARLSAARLSLAGMRVAVLSDVHGNLPALEAVLVEVEREEPDLVVVCGDVAAGPMPVETIELLRTLPRARFVRGNADRQLVSRSDPAGDLTGWAAEEITEDQRHFLDSFGDTVAVEIDGLGRVLFCHGSPRSDEEIMSAATPLDRMRELVMGVETDVVVCGHTHMQFDRDVDGVRVVNPGSVGMPYGEPGAFWALLGPDVEMRRTDYDHEAAAARIRESAWPVADEFARENVLTVPSVEEALAFFAAHGGP
jgi:putative phosphoesterase